MHGTRLTDVPLGDWSFVMGVQRLGDYLRHPCLNGLSNAPQENRSKAPSNQIYQVPRESPLAMAPTPERAQSTPCLFTSRDE